MRYPPRVAWLSPGRGRASRGGDRGRPRPIGPRDGRRARRPSGVQQTGAASAMDGSCCVASIGSGGPAGGRPSSLNRQPRIPRTLPLASASSAPVLSPPLMPLADTVARLAGRPPSALAPRLRPDGAAGVALSLHAAAVEAGFVPAKGGSVPAHVAWPGGREAVEWVFSYKKKGFPHRFELHASLQAATGRMLVQLRELVPAAGGGGKGADAPPPAVAAHAYLGVLAPRYVGAHPLGDTWNDALTELETLRGMVGEILVGPVLASAAVSGPSRLPRVMAVAAVAAAAALAAARARR